MTSLHFYSLVEHHLEAQIANFGQNCPKVAYYSCPAIADFGMVMGHFCPKQIL
jgi:hypothetical protein